MVVAIPAPERHLVEVHLQPAQVGPGVRQAGELGGLLTAILEAGLSDLPDVVGVVDGVPSAPGLADGLRTGAELWAGRIEASLAGDAVDVRLNLCDPAGECSPFEVRAPREEVTAAAAELLASTARKLGKDVSEERVAAWATPQSHDPYAVLLCGRAAAVYYGLRPPVEEALRGDKRRDPIARAVYVDPAMALGWWVVGRIAYGRGEWDAAREAFTRAEIARPSIAARAAEAAALSAAGRSEAAWSAWVAVNAMSPDDPRFAVPRARAALRADRVADAVAVLDALPTRFQDERPVAELRVAIAEVTGQSSNYDELLERWQRAAPNDPEPVRRRVNLRVDAGRWAEALELNDLLAQRGAHDEAALRAIGIAIGLREYDLSAQSAQSLGLVDLADRIRARAAWEADPRAVVAVVEAATDLPGRVAAAHAALARGDAALARQRAEAALKLDPWFPEALDALAQACDALGQPADAAAARAALRRVDPDYGVGAIAALDTPRTAPGSGVSGAQSQVRSP